MSVDAEGTLEEAQTHLLEIGKKLKMTVEQYGIILDQLFLKLEGKKSAVPLPRTISTLLQKK